MSELRIFQRKATKLAAGDNVAVALVDLPAGASVDLAGSTQGVTAAIPAKHKFALRDFPAGGEIVMYGVVVAEATSPIPKGGLISTANVRHQTSAVHSKSGTFTWKAPDVSRWR